MTTQRRILSSLLCGAVLATSAPIGVPTASAQDNTVAPVTVVGRKGAPGADAPKAATCEYLVANDPVLRAQMAQVAMGKNSLAGPKIYLPTRLPRHNNYAAAPLSAPGTPLPPPAKRRKTYSSQTVEAPSPYSREGETIDDNGLVEGSILEGVLGQVSNASMTSQAEQSTTGAQAAQLFAAPAEFSIEEALDACRSTYNPGGGRLPKGRLEIARRDQTMPDGMFLFDEGRYDEALDQFKAAYKKLQFAEGGDEAALMIGKIYLLALRERSDPQEAVTWLKRAANAPFNPATSTPQFDPVEPQRNTATGEAALMLARVYLTGYGPIAKDPAEARKWLERAFYVGHVPAGKMLGDLYYAGRDTPRDLKKAFDLYKQSATLGYAPAQVALADMLYAGEHGAAPDVKTALGWYQEAAKLDNPNALYALAQAYDSGEGVKADPAMAVGFFKNAAIAGSVPAKTAMGTYFYQGDQVAKDHATARKWFASAAADGDPDAMFNLGAMMMNGEGGEQDRTRAWVYFRLAQAKGKPEAGAALTALEKRMTPEEKAAAAKLLAPSA